MNVDVHAHYVPPRLLDAATSATSPVSFDAETQRLGFPSGPSRPIPELLTDVDRRAEWMDSATVEVQVLSPWMDILGGDLPIEEQALWCRMYNDTMAGDLDNRDRFRAMAALPMSSGRSSATELARAVDELGFVGGAIPTQVDDGVDLDIAGLNPVFEAAEAMDVPLFVHPFKVMARQRMDHYFLFNICGNPFETTLAALRLFFSGVFEKWPGLKLLLAHAGGTLPLVAGRAVHASAHVMGFDTALVATSDILQVFYYDTVLHDPRALGFALEVVGSGRFALGSDYPFPMMLEDPLRHLELAIGKTRGVAGAVREVAGITPGRLFGFSPSASSSG